jgi:hypothetical protein
MAEEFSFEKYNTSSLNQKEQIQAELIKNTTQTNPAPKQEKESNKKKINFLELPEIEDKKEEARHREYIDKYSKEEPISVPMENQSNNSYLSLVLSPNLRELELMIRGLEYVKRFNPLLGREEIILRKIPEHPLNERGINEIMSVLKVYSSAEIKLGRKRLRDYYLSIQQVGKTITRLIYKNLKNFGMDTQVKQRHAKTFCLAIIEIMDASFSRSIEGKENDLSRATEFRIEGNIDTLNDPAKMFNRERKEQIKN